MTALALASLAVAFAALAVAAMFGRALTRERRENARAEQRWEQERARLVDQLCHLADKPWTPAPARMSAEPPERERDPDDELAVW